MALAFDGRSAQGIKVAKILSPALIERKSGRILRSLYAGKQTRISSPFSRRHRQTHDPFGYGTVFGSGTLERAIISRRVCPSEFCQDLAQTTRTVKRIGKHNQHFQPLAKWEGFIREPIPFAKEICRKDRMKNSCGQTRTRIELAT